MPNKKGDPLNMDLINMVQNARMMHDNEAVPSKVPGVYWIEAKNPSSENPPTARSGEFQIETHIGVVDEQWQTIKAATESGDLGYKSKVSTVATDGTPHGKQRLICVRTYDADDSDDRTRIEKKLKELGFGTISYQRDSVV